MRKIMYIIAGVLLCFCTSCEDFLNEYSQNQSYIGTADDLAELLLGSGYQDPAQHIVPGLAFATFFNSITNKDMMIPIHLLDDDLKEAPAPAKNKTNNMPWQQGGGFYRWATNPNQTLQGSLVGDMIWADFYQRIAVLNSIISVIPKQRDKNLPGEEETLNQVSGETYFLRAWYYFMLANIYGAPYEKDNPNSEWGVPLKLSEAVVDIKYSRNTVGEVYESIVSDLKKAIEHFKQIESPKSNKQIANENACWAMLSRVYLYMERYEDCIAAANEIDGYSVMNLSSLPTTESFATLECVETIFSHGPHVEYYVFGDDTDQQVSSQLDMDHLLQTGEVTWITTIKMIQCGWSYACSQEFEELFDANDYRYNRFFSRSRYNKNLVPRKYRGRTDYAEYDPVSMDTVVYANSGTPAASAGWLRYSEVLLNKAEAQACLNQSEAINTIQELLQNRYKVMPNIPSGGKDLVDFIRLERRKELCYEGHRWFDLRRYAVNSAYPAPKALEHICHKIIVDDNEEPQTEKIGEVFLEEYNSNSLGSWMLPIPDDVIEFCDGNMKNPERKGVTANFTLETEE